MAIPRATDKLIKARVFRMQQRGMDVDLDGQYGRWRVTTREGSRDLSPRASNREIADWLEAYELGWMAGRDAGVEYAVAEMRHGREVVDGGTDSDVGEGGNRAGVPQAEGESDGQEGTTSDSGGEAVSTDPPLDVRRVR